MDIQPVTFSVDVSGEALMVDAGCKPSGLSFERDLVVRIDELGSDEDVEVT